MSERIQDIDNRALQLLNFRSGKAVTLTLCLSLTAGLPLQAEDITWQGASDDWGAVDNWAGGEAPTYGDTARLGAAGSKEIYLGEARNVDFLIFDSDVSYTLNLQDATDPTANKDTRLGVRGISVIKGDHKIYGRPIATDDPTLALRQALRTVTNADINGNEFVFDIAKNASLDLDVRLQTNSPATVYKRGEGTLIISLRQDGRGALNFPHADAGGVFEVQDGIVRIDASAAVGYSQNDWAANGGTLELTKNFGGGGNHITIKGSGYNGLGAVFASQSVSLSTGIVYINDSARVSADAGKTLTISGLITDQDQSPDDGKHAGLAVTGELVKTGAGTLNITRAAGNSYAGGTLIQAGTILANNTSGSATGSGGITISGSDAGLGGTGIVGGELVVSNGWVSAGATGQNSYGKLTMDELSVKSSGKILVDLQLGNAVAGVGYDQLIVNDELSLEGILGLNIDDTLVTAFGEETFYEQIYFLIDNQGSSSIDGSFLGQDEGSFFEINGYAFELTYLADAGSGSFDGGNDLAIRFVDQIPEPSALVLAFLSCLLPLSIRRR